MIYKYLFNFTRKGKKNEEEMQAGSGVVFTNLLHCVSETLLYSLLKQYSTHVAKDKSDLIIAFVSTSFLGRVGVLYPVTKTAEMYKLQQNKEAIKNLFSTESLTFIT